MMSFPEIPLHRALLALWLLLIPVLGALYVTVPPSPDQSQFDYMALHAIRGQPYYAEFFDMNWPGAMLLHELGQRVLGSYAWTWRATDFLLVQLFSMAAALFLRGAGRRLASFLVLVIMPIVTVTAGYWIAGQRDIIAAGFLIVAVASAQPSGRWEQTRTVLAGLAVMAAVLIRPTYLSFLAILLLLEALPLRTEIPRGLGVLRRSGGLLVGSLVGGALALAYGLSLGIVDDWVELSFGFSMEVYVAEPPQDVGGNLIHYLTRVLHWMTLLGTLGLILWFSRDGLAWAPVITIGLAGTFLISFFVQQKGFIYHLGGFIPLLSLLVAVALDQLNALRFHFAEGRRLVATSILGTAAALTTLGLAAKLEDLRPNMALLAAGELRLSDSERMPEAAKAEVVELIRAGSTPGDRVMQFGTDYDILYRAGRLASHRFITTAADLIRPGMSFYEPWMAEIERDLQDHPPVFVMFDRRAVTGPPGALAAVKPGGPILLALIDHVAEGYRVAYDAHDLLVMQRQ